MNGDDGEKRLQDLHKSCILFPEREQSYYRVEPPILLHRMGVMLMKHFDFKDLMAFGMFLLALLTFVFTFMK